MDDKESTTEVSEAKSVENVDNRMSNSLQAPILANYILYADLKYSSGSKKPPPAPRASRKYTNDDRVLGELGQEKEGHSTRHTSLKDDRVEYAELKTYLKKAANSNMDGMAEILKGKAMEVLTLICLFQDRHQVGKVDFCMLI